jgi:adenylate cyclase
MASDAEFEALGMLDGLEGDARHERIDLISWLLTRGFRLDHIRGSVGAPLSLPANRVIGGDGEYVSAREICQWTGEVKLFRVQRAVPQLT